MEGIPGDYERKAFHSASGELAWARDDVRDVIAVLRDQGLAVLGGQVWYVTEGHRLWAGLVPQRDGGRPGVYSWTAEREPGEEWTAFVGRSAAESSAAVDRMPGCDDLPEPLSGSILYSLTWVSEAELSQLEADRAVAFRRGNASDRSKGEASRPGFFARLFGRR